MSEEIKPSAEGLFPGGDDLGAGYRVRLENYYGPLDLLLHLVKEQEVDVTRLALARVADQYLACVNVLQELDIDIAAEFLVVASALLRIKSRTLVPADEPIDEEGLEDEPDPGMELVQKLLEYKRFKDRGRALGRLLDEQALRWGRPRVVDDPDAPEAEEEVELDLWALVRMWSRISREIRLDVPLSILFHDIPIEAFMRRILGLLEGRGSASLLELVGQEKSKAAIIGTFLAALELTRLGHIRLEQETDKADLRIVKGPGPVAEPEPSAETAPTDLRSGGPAPNPAFAGDSEEDDDEPPGEADLSQSF